VCGKCLVSIVVHIQFIGFEEMQRLTYAIEDQKRNLVMEYFFLL